MLFWEVEVDVEGVVTSPGSALDDDEVMRCSSESSINETLG